mmetsp:Transcript_34832/g.56895  ORF Transcript_34832/g.56895 Transcript_34832/m.56895 type:complete len:149 (+) Transcript_34832:105-551(+)
MTSSSNDVTTLGLSSSYSYHQTDSRPTQTHGTYHCWCPKTNGTRIYDPREEGTLDAGKSVSRQTLTIYRLVIVVNFNIITASSSSTAVSSLSSMLPPQAPTPIQSTTLPIQPQSHPPHFSPIIQPHLFIIIHHYLKLLSLWSRRHGVR